MKSNIISIFSFLLFNQIFSFFSIFHSSSSPFFFFSSPSYISKYIRLFRIEIEIIYKKKNVILVIGDYFIDSVFTLIKQKFSLF